MASAEDIRDFDPLFDSHETLEVEIEAPFGVLVKERPDEEEVSGTFRIGTAEAAAGEFDVAIRTRGKNRRDRETCRFPPMRLNFKKTQTKDTLLHKQDKLKLVTHCETNSARYEQAVISEYLAYRVLNLLTDASFRVRLLRVHYVYSDTNRDETTFAILIEHKDRLGKRIDAKTKTVEKVKVRELRPEDLNRASVYQFFIGNTDYSSIAAAPGEDCCHNQALFVPEDGLYYSVPYDFDRTGWVNAPHATPNPRFNLRSVKVRLYRGRCANNELLDATLQQFRDRRGDIEALVNDQPELTDKTRRYLLKYIGSFFEAIDDPKRLERQLIRKCM